MFKKIAMMTMLLLSTPAAALELGDIEVSSRLGERFAAKIPFTLNEGEQPSLLYAEVAKPNDYRTLQTHYDPALRMIRTDIIRNRLSNWIELSSLSPMNAAVFSIVLKIRYGNATHFKKYPVFLDISHSGRSAASSIAKPAIRSTTLPTANQKDVKAAEDATHISLDAPLLTKERANEEIVTGKVVIEKSTSTFKPFDGWARTSQYGPTVYGDTIYTIANRLRIDERYTIRQVMVALFEKNRAMFKEDNLNLPSAGAYLETPLAEEVERHSYEQAVSIIQDHDLRWKALIKQPRYAAEAKAQKQRYNKPLP